MAGTFGVKLADLDDFISPAQECVKPLIEAAGGGGKLDLGGNALLGQKLENKKADKKAEEAVPLVARPNLIKAKKNKTDEDKATAQVTLSDCLACSGCVTSAETVLLQEQSIDEFIKRARESPLTVVSISAEARADLAVHFKVSPLLALQKLASLLRQNGADYVLESSAAESIALLEAKEDFARRMRSKKPKGSDAHLPLLTSHCPGWTCYAEKTVDPVVLPHLSTVRPPQQIQGRLVKTKFLGEYNQLRFLRWWRVRNPLLAAHTGRWLRGVSDELMHRLAGLAPLTAKDVYHVSVQPCFDRKIESMRPQFVTPPGDEGIKEVDTVIATNELMQLLEKEAERGGVTVDEVFAALTPTPLDDRCLTNLSLRNLGEQGRPMPLICPVSQNGSAGGYLEYIFRKSAEEIYGVLLPDSPLEFRTKQNEDMREVVLEDQKTHRVVSRFVAAYGFRNVQNVIRRITKPVSNPQDSNKSLGEFVEVMACPGGCLNGGGQIPVIKDGRKNAADQSDRKQHLEDLEAAFHNGEGTAVVGPMNHPDVEDLYRFAANRAGSPGARTRPWEELIGEDAVRKWFGTSFKSLKQDEVGNDIVAMSSLKW